MTVSASNCSLGFHVCLLLNLHVHRIAEVPVPKFNYELFSMVIKCHQPCWSNVVTVSNVLLIILLGRDYFK